MATMARTTDDELPTRPLIRCPLAPRGVLQRASPRHTRQRAALKTMLPSQRGRCAGTANRRCTGTASAARTDDTSLLPRWYSRHYRSVRTNTGGYALIGSTLALRAWTGSDAIAHQCTRLQSSRVTGTRPAAAMAARRATYHPLTQKQSQLRCHRRCSCHVRLGTEKRGRSPPARCRYGAADSSAPSTCTPALAPTAPPSRVSGYRVAVAQAARVEELRRYPAAVP